jgi:hypothetical protein
MSQSHYHSLNLADKCNRHYRRLRAKNPGLLRLAPGGGRVIGNGKVELTVENGARLIYRVAPRIEYVAVLEKSFAPPKAAAASPADQAKPHYDALLDILSDLERQICAYGAKHSPSNVVNIAAE